MMNAISVTFQHEIPMPSLSAARRNTGEKVDKLERVDETEETVTIPQLKQAYIDGRIDEVELEDRLDELAGW